MNSKKHRETAAWIRDQIDIINPYEGKSAYIYSTAFLSSVLADLMHNDTLALTKFKLAVAAKWRSQQGPAA